MEHGNKHSIIENPTTVVDVAFEAVKTAVTAHRYKKLRTTWQTLSTQTGSKELLATQSGIMWGRYLYLREEAGRLLAADFTFTEEDMMAESHVLEVFQLGANHQDPLIVSYTRASRWIPGLGKKLPNVDYSGFELEPARSGAMSKQVGLLDTVINKNIRQNNFVDVATVPDRVDHDQAASDNAAFEQRYHSHALQVIRVGLDQVARGK